MGTIVEAVVTADEFALRETSRALPDIAYRLERVVAQDADRIMPFMWVAGVDRDRLETALLDDPSVDGFELVTDLGSKWLYQMNWIDRIDTLVGTIVDEQAVLLEAEGTGGRWELKFLFIEREAIRRVQESFEEMGSSFEADRIYDQREGELGTHGLTDKQHRTLSQALAGGYYAIPREMDAVTLAEVLDISHQALSEQLRRAHATVVADVIGTDDSFLPED